jgi:hypothetical protein
VGYVSLGFHRPEQKTPNGSGSIGPEEIPFVIRLRLELKSLVGGEGELQLTIDYGNRKSGRKAGGRHLSDLRPKGGRTARQGNRILIYVGDPERKKEVGTARNDKVVSGGHHMGVTLPTLLDLSIFNSRPNHFARR